MQSRCEHRGLATRTRASDALSKDLKRRGFKFVGATICYAYLQVLGMANDRALAESKK